MAIYQNAERNKILLNAYGVVIDPSLILCYDAGNPYSYYQKVTGNPSNYTPDPVTDLSSAGNNGNMQILTAVNTTTGSNGGVFYFTGELSGGTNPANMIVVDTTSMINSFNSNPLSVSLWFYLDDQAATLPFNSDVITNANVVNTDRGFRVGTLRQLSVHVGNGVTATGYYTVPNEWYHATLIYSATNVQLYMNSVLVWSRGSAANASTGATVSIGGNWNLVSISVNANALVGRVGLPMIYNKVLTQAEINQNYTSQAARFGLTNQTLPPLKLSFDPGNIASYDPNGATPTKIYDLSGNNYTGSLSASIATALPPVYDPSGGGSLYFTGQALANAGSGSYIGGFVSGSSAPGNINIGSVHTVDMWVNMDTFIGIWMTKQATPDYMYYILATTGNNRCDTGGALVDFVTGLTTNNWYNIVTVRNGDAIWCYVNGVMVSPGYDGGNSTTDFTLFKIGGYQTTSGYYPRGYLGAFKIYSGTLTGIQVYNNFQSTRARYGV